MKIRLEVEATIFKAGERIKTLKKESRIFITEEGDAEVNGVVYSEGDYEIVEETEEEKEAEYQHFFRNN